MALAEDASSPSPVSATNSGTQSITTASFSPPSNSVVVAMFSYIASGSGGVTDVTLSDNHGSTWTLVKRLDLAAGSADGGAIVGFVPFSSAPGATTVTGTGVGGSGTFTKVLTVKVVTGADLTHTGSGPSYLATDGIVNAVYSGSWVYGACCDDNNNVLTPTAATTVSQNVQDGSVIATCATFRSVNTTTSGVNVDIGLTGATGVMSVALLEIPATVSTTSLLEDGSSPSGVSATNSSTRSITTASFSPPANSLVVAMFAFEANSTGASDVQLSDSKGSNYASVRRMSGNGSGGGIVGFTYFSSAPGSMTVTGTGVGGGANFEKVLQVKVLTGADQAQLGSGITNDTTDTSLLPGYSGSFIYGVAFDDNNDLLTPTAFTTVFQNVRDSTVNSVGATFRSTNATLSNQYVDVGVQGATGYMGVCLLEITQSTSGMNVASSSTTINEDASTPRIVQSTSNTATTQSFTPPNGSLIVVMAAYEAANVGCTGLNVTDSHGSFYQPVAGSPILAQNASGLVSMGYTYYANSPGSTTVTATGAGGVSPFATELNVRVLKNAATAQVSGFKTSGFATRVGINATHSNSLIYGVCADDLRSNLTAIGGTTVMSNRQDRGTGSTLATWKSSQGTKNAGFTGNTYGMKGGYGADIVCAMEVIGTLDFTSAIVGQMYPIIVGQLITGSGQTSGFALPNIKPIPTGYALPAPGVQPPPIPAQEFAILISTGPLISGTPNAGVPVGFNFQVQKSYDNSNWLAPSSPNSIYNFPTIAGSVQIGRVFPAEAPYYRLSWTVQGSNPSTTFTAYVVPAL